MLPPRGKPSVAPYPWDRVQAHLRGIPGLLAIAAHLRLAPPHPEFLSLPLSHSLWPLGNSTPCDTSPLTLSGRFLLFLLLPSAQIRPPPGSPPGPTGLFRHHPPWHFSLILSCSVSLCPHQTGTSAAATSSSGYRGPQHRAWQGAGTGEMWVGGH